MGQLTAELATVASPIAGSSKAPGYEERARQRGLSHQTRRRVADIRLQQECVSAHPYVFVYVFVYIYVYMYPLETLRLELRFCPRQGGGDSELNLNAQPNHAKVKLYVQKEHSSTA